MRDAPGPWTLHDTISVSNITNDPRNFGVVLADDRYFISSGGMSGIDDNFIYILTRDGELLDSFHQFGESHYGMRDLAWDGGLIWGVADEWVYGFNVEGDSITSFEGPYRFNQSVAWDSDRELLWIAGKLTNFIIGYNREGVAVDSVSQFDLMVYGLAYHPQDNDGYPLYVTHRGRVRDDRDYQAMHKINPDVNDTLFVGEQYHEGREPDGKPEGIFITDRYDPHNWVAMAIADDGPDDRLDIWQISSKTSWMLLAPDSGNLDPEGAQDLTLSIDATDLVPVHYPGELRFIHNGFGGATSIPVDLTVTGLRAGEQVQNIPLAFNIKSIHPNPFNSTTTISYSLPSPQRVTVNIFDISGRLVERLYDGAQATGYHSMLWDSRAVGSGIYFVQLQTEKEIKTAKLAVIK